MPAYSLGAFNFIHANRDDVRGGIPPLPMENISVFMTPGIDGCAVRNDGKWGEPFQYRTCAYETSSAAALSMFELYKQTPGQVPQNLVWEGIDYDTTSVRFAVLRVGEEEIRRTSSLIVDNVVVGNAYLVYATWTLMPVDMS